MQRLGCKKAREETEKLAGSLGILQVRWLWLRLGWRQWLKESIRHNLEVKMFVLNANLWASLVAQLVKKSACNARDLGSIPGLGRSRGEGKGYPIQYSGLENSMDCTIQGSQSLTRLSYCGWLIIKHLGGAPRYLSLELLDGFLERGRLEKGHIWGKGVLVEFQEFGLEHCGVYWDWPPRPPFNGELAPAAKVLTEDSLTYQFL